MNEIRAQVLGHVVNAGAAGAAAPEVAAALAGDGDRHPFNRRRNLVTGRLAELASMGLVVKSGLVRDGWPVWTAATVMTAAGGDENNSGTKRPSGEGPTS